MTSDTPRKKITLALGGGGARGLAHLGVIERLDKAGFEIARIVGTSIGSLAGGLYAFDPDIDHVLRRVLTYLSSPGFRAHQERLLRAQQRSEERSTFFGWYQKIRDVLKAGSFFRRVMSHRSLLPGTVLLHVSEHLLPHADISESKIPLAIVAIDLNSGHQVVLESGPLTEAVKASSSLAGIFPPVRWGGHLLCDAGTACALPTWVARSYGNHPLVAVDVSAPALPVGDCATAFDVLVRMNEISEVLFRRQAATEADVLICPEVSSTAWFDFTNPNPLIEAGRRAADAALPKLKAHFNA